jgi:hypothetical protein
MKTNGPPAKQPEDEHAKPVCGIVMPISAVDGCAETHWLDVREILSEAIDAAGFEANLVSDADEVGIIQKRIIQNIYENPIVVCDVSGKNPNVMFELGLRLAFDKPTIIVKDDKTSYSFDTSIIEHLEYPRDLRFSKIVDFKDELTEKIQATHEKALKDKNYTTFLKHFGTFTVPKLDTQEVSKDTFIIEELQSLRKMVADLANRGPMPSQAGRKRTLCLQTCPPDVAERVLVEISKIENIGEIRTQKPGNKHAHFVLAAAPQEVRDKALLVAKEILPGARFI